MIWFTGSRDSKARFIFMEIAEKMSSSSCWHQRLTKQWLWKHLKNDNISPVPNMDLLMQPLSPRQRKAREVWGNGPAPFISQSGEAHLCRGPQGQEVRPVSTPPALDFILMERGGSLSSLYQPEVYSWIHKRAPCETWAEREALRLTINKPSSGIRH